MVTLTTNLLSKSCWLWCCRSISCSINVRLTLMLLVMAPVAVIVALAFRRIARTVTQRAERVTAKINAQIQESVSGIVVAKSFRQERAIYTTFAANNRQAYGVGLRRGLTFDSIFPILNICPGWPWPCWSMPAAWRSGAAASAPATGTCSCRPSASSVAADQHRLLLEPVPGRPGGRRARLRADRRRAEGGPDGDRAGGAARWADRVPGSALQLHPDRDDRVACRARSCCPTSRWRSGRRDGGAGRSHRRGQEQRRQADQPLLRVPGRRAAGRRARHPPPGPGRVPPADRPGAAGAVPLLRHRAGQHPLRPARRDRRRGVRRGRAASRAATGWPICRTGWTPTWASAGPTSRWGSANWWRWRACCSRTRPS